MDGAIRTDAAVSQWLSETEEPIAQFYTDYTLIIKTKVVSYEGVQFNDSNPNIGRGSIWAAFQSTQQNFDPDG